MRRRSAPPPSAQQMIREYLGRVSVAATKVLPKGDRLLFVGRTRAALEAKVGPLASADADVVLNALITMGDPEELAKRERERLYSARRRGAAAAPPTLWKPSKESRRGAAGSRRGACRGSEQAGATPPPAGQQGPPQGRRRPWPHRGADRPGRAAASGNGVHRRRRRTPASAVPRPGGLARDGVPPGWRRPPGGGVRAAEVSPPPAVPPGKVPRPRMPPEQALEEGWPAESAPAEPAPAEPRPPRNRKPSGAGAHRECLRGRRARPGPGRAGGGRTRAGGTESRDGPEAEPGLPGAGDTGRTLGPGTWIEAGRRRRTARRRAGCARGGRRLRPARPRRCRSCPA